MKTKKTVPVLLGAALLVAISTQAQAHSPGGLQAGGLGFTIADRNFSVSTFLFGPPRPPVHYFQPIPVPVPRWSYAPTHTHRHFHGGPPPKWKRHHNRHDNGYYNRDRSFRRHEGRNFRDQRRHRNHR